MRPFRILQIYDEKEPSLVPYLVFSLALHAILLSLVATGVGIKIPTLKEEAIEVIPVYEKGGAYEIADIARPAVEKRPKKAKYLGMYDSSVDEETVAQPRDRSTKKGGGGTPKPAAPKRPVRDLYSIDRDLFAMRSPEVTGRGGGDIGPQFREDFYPDYKFGDHTYLNVLRYPDVDYFVRMKRQFKMTFNPAPVLRSYFLNNRVTQGSVEVAMAVSVDKTGSLSELFILKSSGIPSYDHEAMRTVRASAPFAKPPKQFLADDGLLRMSWTFTVYL